LRQHSLLRVAAVLAILVSCSEDEGPTAGEADAAHPAAAATTFPARPLELTLLSPADGALFEESSLYADGALAGGITPTLTLNGAIVAPTEGTWSAEVERSDARWQGSPIWPVLAEATDVDSAWLRERATAIHGETADVRGQADDCVMVRLSDAGLVQLLPVVESQLSEYDPSGALASKKPAAEVLGIDIYVTDAGLGSMTLDADLTAAGLTYTATAREVWADFETVGWYETAGTVIAGRVDMNGTLEIGVVRGVLEATPEGTEIEVSDLRSTLVDDSFGIVEALVDWFYADNLAASIEDAIRDAVEELMSVQDDLRALTLGEVGLVLSFTDVRHDEDGVSVWASADLSLDSGASGLPGERFTTRGERAEVLGAETPSGAEYGMVFAIDDDFLSALGPYIVAAELLDREVSGEVGGMALDTTLLGSFISGLDQLPEDLPVAIVTRAAIPLLGTAGADSTEALRIHLGGLELGLVVELDGVDTEVMRLAVDAVIALAGDADELLAVTLVEREVTLLVTTLEVTPDEVEPGVETLMEIAMPIIIDDALDGLRDFELPFAIEILENAELGEAGHGAVFANVAPADQ